MTYVSGRRCRSGTACFVLSWPDRNLIVTELRWAPFGRASGRTVMTIQRVTTTITGFSGAPGYWRHYFKDISGLGGSVMAQLCVDRVRDSVVAAGALFSSSVTYNVSGLVDELDESSGQITGQQSVTGRTQIGGAAGTLGPIVVGLVAQYNTNDFVNGRRIRGRSFLNPIRSVYTQDAAPQATVLGLASAFASQLDNPGATTVRFGVYTRPKGGTPGAWHDVVNTNVPQKWTVLRSRRD